MSTPPRKVFCAGWLRQSCNDRGGDEGTGSEDTGSIWEDTPLYRTNPGRDGPPRAGMSPGTVSVSAPDQTSLIIRNRRTINPN
jgi:hypothetical protein